MDAASASISVACVSYCSVHASLNADIEFEAVLASRREKQKAGG